MAQVADPLGDSYFVEALTDAMEARVRELLREIDAAGGMVEALRRGEEPEMRGWARGSRERIEGRTRRRTS